MTTHQAGKTNRCLLHFFGTTETNIKAISMEFRWRLFQLDVLGRKNYFRFLNVWSFLMRWRYWGINGEVCHFSVLEMQKYWPKIHFYIMNLSLTMNPDWFTDHQVSIWPVATGFFLLLKSGYIPGYALLYNYLINYCCHSLLEHIYPKVKSLGSVGLF